MEEEEGVIQQEASTFQDYGNTLSPFFIPADNPQLQFNFRTDIEGTVDVNEPEMKTYYDSADINTQREMLRANNNSDAIKIAQRRDVFRESQEAVNQDGILTQIAMGIPAALASPSSLLPFGAIFKVAQTANRVSKMTAFIGAGAVAGGTASVIDEAIFDLQGMPTNYLGAAGIGIVLGGGLGGLSAALSGPQKGLISHATDSKNDSFSLDFNKDPSITIELDANGIPKITDIAPMKKSLLDRTPIGKFFKSDIHSVYQGGSDATRSLMSRLASPTVSLKDSQGNLIPTPKNAVNVKKEADGIHQVMIQSVSQSFEASKKLGYEGNLEKYNKDIWASYSEAMNVQRNALHTETKADIDIKRKELQLQKKEEIDAVNEDLVFYRDEEGKTVPATKEVIEDVKAQEAADVKFLEESKAYDDTVAAITQEHTEFIKGNKEARKAYEAELNAWYKQDLEDWKIETKEIDAKRQAWVDEQVEYDYKLGKGRNKKELKGLKEKYSKEVDEVMELSYPIKPTKGTVDNGPIPSTLELPDAPIKPINTAPKIEIKPRPAIERDKLTAEVDAKYSELYETSRRDIENNFIDNLEVKFKGDVNIVKAAEAYRKYFQDMLKKSQDLGIKELKNINLNRMYAPRTYDYKAIQKGKVTQDQVRAEVRAGLEGDVRNSALTTKQLDEAVDGIVIKLNESAFNLDNLSTSYMVKDLPFSTHLKQVKLYLNENNMPSILKNSMEDITGAYHYKMSGRQGIQYAFGTDDLGDIQKLIREDYLKQGKLDTEEVLTAFERIVKDVAGDLRMNQLADTPAWTWTRNVSTVNSLRLGGGFGGNQFIELMSAITMQGFKALVSGRLMTSFKTSGRLLYTKNPDIDSFSQFLINSGHLETVLHTSRINRYADNDSGFNSGWLENTINGWNDKLMKVNGMRYFTGVMEDYTGGAIMSMLKEGGIPAERIARWGLTPEQAKNLGTKLKEATKGKDFDVSKLNQQELDQFQLAINNGMQEMVVQGDSLHLPNWMKAPGPALKLFTQFMRFPMVAQEVLLRKGLVEEQAQMAAGVIASTLTFMGIKYLREQAAIATGSMSTLDAKYNYDKFTDKDWLRVIGEAANYTAPLGMMSTITNAGFVLSGNPGIGRDWADKDALGMIAGPTGGAIKDVFSISTALGQGKVDERTYKKAKNFIPGQNLPIIKEALDTMVEELVR